MKAAVIEAPEKLTVKEVAEPVMGDYDCLCEVLFGATCSGTDRHLIAGDPMPFPVSYPTILGHESIGKVIKAGPKVEHFKVGDIVTRVVNNPTERLDSHWGGFAEMALISDHEALEKTGVDIGFFDGIHKVLPDEIDPAAATMIITWRETFSFISRIGVPANGRVLVIGSGANGLSFVNHAANMLASKIVMLGSHRRENAALAVGCTDYVDYKLENIVECCNDRGLHDFDLIIDAVGKQGQLDRVAGLLKPKGVMTIYGADDFGEVTITPSRTRGGFTYADYGYNEGQVHETVIKLIRKGLLKAENYCDLENIYPLECINDAFEAVRKRQVIKAIIKL